MNALTELSDELLLEIFKYVDYKDIARIAAVNKQFKAISEDDFLWNNHPNIVSVLPNEDEFIELMANHKVNSKNLAKLRTAWNSYRWTVQQFPEPIKALTPPTSLISPRSIADMLVASILSKIELFHMLDSPIAATNPFKTAVNIIKSQGWLSLFDGFGKEAFLRLYYKTFIPRQYPGFDNFITWIFLSGTAFWQTRTIPDRSHIRRWLRAGLQFILRQTLTRRLMRFYFARRHRNYFVPALIIGLASVPFSAFAMRTLLGNQTPRDTFVGAMKSALTWKLWVMPLVRFSVTFGSVVLKNTVLKWYYKRRYNAQLNKERNKFLQLLDHNQTQQ